MEFKYYKDAKTGDVYAYEGDGSQDEYIKPDLVAMTDAEIHAHLNPAPTAETRRAERDALLMALDRVVSNPLRWAEFTTGQQKTLATYRQALKDIPQQPGFPTDVSWPKAPGFL